jgi:molybdopterin-binding protein
MELLRASEAARELGVSYPTLKQWIYQGRLKSVKTPGGHHRIPRAEIDRISEGKRGRRSTGGPKRSRGTVSGRNKLRGRVVEVHTEGLLSQVRIDIGGQVVTSIITRAAAEEMGLRKGMSVMALIKATEVMVIRD